jgi:branched-chain amino acid transport system permease protein
VLNGLTLLVWGGQPTALLVFAEANPIGVEQRLQPIRVNSIDFLGAHIDVAERLGGQISIDQPRLYAFGFSILAFVAFWLFFRFTTVGLAMRATSENQRLAQSAGLRVRVILAIAWAVAALLAGIAGTLHGGAAQLDTNMQYLALRAFPAVLLGGLESVEGAFVGGIAIGFTEEFAKLMFSGEVGEQLAPYVVLMIVLVIRPDGLFGQKRIERI